MVNESFTVKLPDSTKLVAECEQNGEHQSVKINFVDAHRQQHTVAIAEYKNDAPIGRKLHASGYNDFSTRPMFSHTFNYCVKPTYEELSKLYQERPDEQYIYNRYEDREELHTTTDYMLVYRDFCSEHSNNHTKHDIRLTEYAKKGEAVNYSFECFDCFDIIYSVDKPYFEEIDSDEVEFKVKDITNDKSYTDPPITYLDDIEDECWELFKAYASYVGVEFGEGIDYSIAKELSAKFMSVVERVFGIPFPTSKEG